MDTPYSIIVLPDPHLPYEDRRDMRAIEDYIADSRFDEWLCLGDALDFDILSRFDEKNLRRFEGKDLEMYYQAGNAWLDRQQSLIRKGNRAAKFTLLEGNHEGRVEKLIDAMPGLRHTVEVERNLNLIKRHIVWVRCDTKGALYKVGKAYFTHGRYFGSGHAKKMVENYGVNIFYGHTHDVQGFTKPQWGKDKVLAAQSFGCLCDQEKLEYIKGSPVNWEHAFGVFYVMAGGFFTFYPVRIYNHSFTAPNGVTYSG
jgi:predicted phosphodiesterase